MDEDSRELVKAAAEGGAEGFLRTIAAPLVEAGEWGADIIRRHRFKTQVKTLVRAKQMCEDAGIPPQAISMKVFVPLLENVSVEDDPAEAADPAAAEAMHERWAALLANAAIGDSGAAVLPSFPQILAELSAPDAAMLDWLAQREHPPTPLESLLDAVGVTELHGDNPPRLRALVQLGNLERLGLCSVARPNAELNRLAEEIGGRTQPQRWTLVEITDLGKAFVAACTPPTPAQES